MMNREFDVTGIGNAIVDVIAKVDDAFLAAEGLQKGAMALIDADQAKALYAKLEAPVIASGGSVANSMAGLASFGGKAAFVGKVAGDALGEGFKKAIQGLTVSFETPISEDGAPTATSMVLVTPDGQRTMNTFLGACVNLGPEDIDPTLIQKSKVTYLEGYLFDPPRAKQAFMMAGQIAKQASAKVALSLSDSFCVDRHRKSFIELIQSSVNILFANEDELRSLFKCEALEPAIKACAEVVEVVVVTRGEKGSVVGSGGQFIEVPAEPVKAVVDTTGAGDLYAAGFLYGYTQGLPMGDWGRLGSLAAAEVISHMGARPEVSLASLI